ncbi:hypothetical protein SEVIR_9G200733v4 [Setaria viridis]|uniref:Uncharacterized protein n=1 Tax=Setaria viridis TaxID=4556 RepID=A0A4U6SW03_SETVI|nr:hypothetical protein SEVIR_9G200733v2 [Setaria viridis]
MGTGKWLCRGRSLQLRHLTHRRRLQKSRPWELGSGFVRVGRCSSSDISTTAAGSGSQGARAAKASRHQPTGAGQGRARRVETRRLRAGKRRYEANPAGITWAQAVPPQIPSTLNQVRVEYPAQG